MTLCLREEKGYANKVLATLQTGGGGHNLATMSMVDNFFIGSASPIGFSQCQERGPSETLMHGYLFANTASVQGLAI